jgi:AraC-like DNA-binding protein
MAAQRNPIREWREQYARRWLNIDFEPLSDTPFRFSLKPIFEGLRVARVAFSPGFTFRDNELVKDGEDAFVVFISQSKSIDLTLRGRALRLGYGDATLLSSDTTGRIGSHLGMERIAVMIPRTEFAACGIRPADTMMQRLPHRSEGLRLLRAYLRSLEKTPIYGSTEVRDTLRRHIIDLSALALMPKAAIGESDLTAVAAARVAGALDHIATHFQEPELSVEAVARRQGISPRYLQRLLERTGKSFIARVNELRLEEAFKLVAGTHESGCRISDIALQVGFSDISHFNRSFRSRFGDTPSGVRAGHRTRQ